MTAPVKARLYHLTREEAALAGALTAARQDAVRVELPRGARSPAADAGPGAAMPFAAGAEDDGLANFSMHKPQPAAAAAPAAPDAAGKDMAARVAAVRAENLTARQLRVAQRMAEVYGIHDVSEHEAVVRLRDMGLDPFDRSNLIKALRNLSAEAARTQQAAEKTAENAQALARIETAKVPANAPRKDVGPAKERGLPSREEMTEERRAAEILAIQRDIARRRRKRMMMLAMRLFLLIGVPTLIAAYYYTAVASPLYTTKSQFLIQIPEGSRAQVSGNIFTTSPMLTTTDSIAVQSYLTSRDAMLRLDREKGFRQAYQDPALDPLIRLSPNASNEETYARYKKSVKIGFDPTEGVITMEVTAPDPALSQEFSMALIRYAEGQVDSMSSRLRDDQMKGAMEAYDAAEGRLIAAQARLQDLQTRLGVLNPESEGAALLARVNSLESELTKKKLELGQLTSNAQPNASRVAGVRGDISRLEAMIAETRAKMTEATTQTDSLAVITGEIKLAESELQIRQQLLTTAAEQVDSARMEANKQVRYLSLSMAPVPPDEPTKPRAFEDTLIAFFLLCGAYLMLSLTVSILREQVST